MILVNPPYLPVLPDAADGHPLRSSGRVFDHAAVFGLFALITGHGLLWILLVFVGHFGPVGASFTVFGLDVLAALVCVLFGRRSYLTTDEVEARIMRDRCMTQMRDSVTMAAVTATVATAVGRGGTRKVWDIVRGKKD